MGNPLSLRALLERVRPMGFIMVSEQVLPRMCGIGPEPCVEGGLRSQSSPWRGGGVLRFVVPHRLEDVGLCCINTMGNPLSLRALLERVRPMGFIMVFTPLSEPLIEEECEDNVGLRLLTKARYSMARFKGEQIVILSQVLANEVNIGYEDLSNEQVLKLNGTRIKNIHHLAHLIDSCTDNYLIFEFEDKFLVVLERGAAKAASPRILKDYGIPSERSSDLLDPYTDASGEHQPSAQREFGDNPISNSEFGFEGVLWV